MKARNVIFTILIAIAGGLIAVFAYTKLVGPPETVVTYRDQNSAWYTSMPEDFDAEKFDFTYAAERTVHGVVHVKTTRERERREIRDPFEFFFGPRQREIEPEPVVGFGSGVILSPDGYIVTNYHVIKDADEVEVTLNDKRVFTAEIIGKDPNTDIALLKIDKDNLPFIQFGNSDELRLGQWVLAVGNPFNLTSSVTAGIVSAKGRAFGVLRDGEMPIESFIQTDAAVNVGNSGGALVNLKGELVGIPTLIVSPTRTHAGNAFAVPSAIVRKVVEDLIEFGEVQRGVLGVTIDNVSEVAREKDLDRTEGVYIIDVVKGSSADNAGIRAGDIIIEIDGVTVNSTGELQEQIGRRRPGENVDILLLRNGRTREVTANLLSLDDHRDLVVRHEEELLGARFRKVPDDLREKLNIQNGVQVVELESGELRSAGVQEGFIIIAVNNHRVSEPSDILRLLQGHSGGVYIEGVYPDGTRAYYAFGL